MRINKFIAANTKFSRRKADELIKEGRVFLNGEEITELGIQIDPEKDIIKIGQETISTKNEKIYLALNKPGNFITTREDELNRKTVMDLVPKIENLKPVGRLDKDTEGLLLLSNDGEFINRYTHPKFECEKEYIAKIEGYLEEEEKNILEKGIVVDGRKTSRAKISIINASEQETDLRIIIHEGRNKQIRKMFDQLNHPVKYLQRVRINNINLGSLKIGTYRKLTKNEINAN